MKKNIVYKTAFTALFCAQAIVLSYLEGLIPTSSFMPPGAKLGLSNIITMFCAEAYGFPCALTVTVFKALFAFLTRGVTAGIMSLSGGLLSTIVMILLIKIKKVDIGYIGIAVSSAITHNAAQLFVSAFICATPMMVIYAPVLLMFSVVTGVLTGMMLKAVVPVLHKLIIVKGVG